MKVYHCFWIVPILIASVFSCTSHTVTVSELQAYMQQSEHGLIHVVEDQGYQLMLSYKPEDMVVFQYYKHEIQQGSIDIDSIRTEVQKFIFLTLHLTYQQQAIEQQFVADPSAYHQAIQYISHGMAKDIYLKIPSQSNLIPVVAYHYIPMYGMDNASSILLTFPVDDIMKENSFTIQVKDRRLGFGTVSFTFQTKDIKEIPRIDFNNEGHDRNI